MSIGHNGEGARGIDFAKTSKSHGRRVQSFGEPVRLEERQIHSGRHPGYGGHRQQVLCWFWPAYRQ